MKKKTTTTAPDADLASTQSISPAITSLSIVKAENGYQLVTTITAGNEIVDQTFSKVNAKQYIDGEFKKLAGKLFFGGK